MSFILSALSLSLLFSYPMALLANDAKETSEMPVKQENVQREKELLHELALLTRQQEMLKEQYSETQERLLNTIEQLKETREQQQSLTGNIKELNEGLYSLVEKNTRLEREKEGYEERIEMLSVEKEKLEKDLSSTTESLKTMAARSHELENSLSKTQQHCREVERINLGIEAGAARKVLELQDLIIKYLAQQQQDMKDEDRKTKSKLQETVQQMEETKNKHKNLQESIQELTSSIEMLTEQNAQLSESNRSVVEARESLTKEKERLEENLASAEEQLSSLTHKEKMLNAELESTRNEYQEAKRARLLAEAKAAQEIHVLRNSVEELSIRANDSSWSKALDDHFFKLIVFFAAGGLTGYGIHHYYHVQ